ncbi:MBL fold metallo-hydrolase [Parapedobacter koreensis]|uniref:Putative mRNA 3-end processing factor n=1 Tax=Parapedobacter koreensis TaxID=332977 RepID=A0A1H7M510_9SPHI|nr:MBL fold metallo-hydrolase [Parapedobacter koreensis]SEL06212.1 putative mRNA 3-end processing factor [Parapedobacter koreensis]
MVAQILADFLVKRPEGYYCKYGDFFVDPLSPVSRALVSHAHADHASPGHGEIYCTPPTAAFMRYRYSRQPFGSFREFHYHQPFQVGGVTIHFMPAGHILGSAQLVMAYNGIRYLYTGDYKLQADDTCEPLEAVQADVLITESTFAHPQVTHPDPVAEISKINGKPHHVLLGSYALGKAQRLTSLLNKHCPERRVLVHHGILPIHQLYASMGIKHLRYEPYNRKEMKTQTAHHIYLVPPMAFNSYFRATNVIRVFASGWKHLQHHNDMELYISDHVDWKDILHYIAQVNPREIWTIHGDGRHLADHYSGQIMVKTLG